MAFGAGEMSAAGVVLLMVWEVAKQVLGKKGVFRSKCMGRDIVSLAVTAHGEIKSEGKKKLTSDQVEALKRVIHSFHSDEGTSSATTVSDGEPPPHLDV